MKKNKGFTLVELLAVIVILAIIMIIAIPAVLETMENAKKKAMMEFAQKVMNKAEEKYYESIAMGKSMKTGAEITAVVYDIRKDLGINNTGNYYGYVSIDVMDTERIRAAEGGGWETVRLNEILKEIMLFQDDLMLGYGSVSRKEMDLSNFHSDVAYVINNKIKQANIKFEDFPYKKMQYDYVLKQYCNYYSLGVIDGATGEQVGGINEPKYETNFHYNDDGVFVCNFDTYEEEINLKLAAIDDAITEMKR